MPAVYFDQYLGATHSKRWSKKEQREGKTRQKNVFTTMVEGHPGEMRMGGSQVKLSRLVKPVTKMVTGYLSVK